MKLTVELDEQTLRQLVIDHLSSILCVQMDASEVKIEVKSKQNYKAEWEKAEFRARLEIER